MRGNSKSILTVSISALLSEYKKAIDELINIIKPIGKIQLSTTVDNTTNNPDCISIQSILSHIICSGYNNKYNSLK
jgi:hypothetical protein